MPNQAARARVSRRRLLVLAALWASLLPGRAAAQQPPVAADATPRHATFTLDSRVLGERRRYNVYTPPAYATGTAAYPVLYMPDGGMAEDFPHVVNTLDSLIGLGRVPAMLVVGIENTERRRDLTGPTREARDLAIAPRVGGSAAFRGFLREELMPEIRRRYRVTDETALVGESLAGLFVIETLLEDPALFRRYLAIDPSLWWGAEALARGAAARLGGLDLAGRSLYLTAAGVDGNVASVERLVEALRSAAPAGFTWHHDPRPAEHHATIFRGTLPEGLLRVLP
ncbi:MAG: alpha/beta hydrolase [Gemmatimonadetes bacterium]|nr:alpha/beta hydrolase [Gemmatimonadota bacterium]